jgi:hypothetical protein
MFVTNMFDNYIVLCLSYSTFFDKFIGSKLNIAIIFKHITSQGFLCDVFNVNRIPTDYRFIDSMGLNFFNTKFSLKSTFVKV